MAKEIDGFVYLNGLEMKALPPEEYRAYIKKLSEHEPVDESWVNDVTERPPYVPKFRPTFIDREDDDAPIEYIAVPGEHFKHFYYRMDILKMVKDFQERLAKTEEPIYGRPQVKAGPGEEIYRLTFGGLKGYEPWIRNFQGNKPEHISHSVAAVRIDGDAVRVTVHPKGHHQEMLLRMARDEERSIRAYPRISYKENMEPFIVTFDVDIEQMFA